MSADGKWRWNVTDLVAYKAALALSTARILNVASWVGAAISTIFALFCLLSLVAAVGERVQSSSAAPSTLGSGLILLSIAIVFAMPIAFRLAGGRGLVTATGIVAGIVFLGSCGTGVALVAAYPLPSPSPAVAESLATSSPSKKPVNSSRPQPATSPSPANSQQQSPSPSPNP